MIYIHKKTIIHSERVKNWCNLFRILNTIQFFFVVNSNLQHPRLAPKFVFIVFMPYVIKRIRFEKKRSLQYFQSNQQATTITGINV